MDNERNLLLSSFESRKLEMKRKTVSAGIALRTRASAISNRIRDNRDSKNSRNSSLFVSSRFKNARDIKLNHRSGMSISIGRQDACAPRLGNMYEESHAAEYIE